MSSAVTSTVLIAAVVPPAGTFTIPYPAGTSGALFANAVNHKMYAMGSEYSSPKDFSLAFGGSNITVTWTGLTTLPIGENIRLGLDILGADVDDDVPLNRQIVRAPLVGFYFGAPAAAAANSIALTQAVAAGGSALLNGVRGGYLDVPRNIVAAWTGTAVATIRGTDVDGQLVSELSASGVAHTGKKAFATISEIRFQNAITGLTIGHGLQLGFPSRVNSASQLIYEVKNGVVAAPSGATTAGITTASTGTSGDVRGTYAPLTPPDGLTAYSLVAISNAPDDRGINQYYG
jgi:hypothetical protein